MHGRLCCPSFTPALRVSCCLLNGIKFLSVLRACCWWWLFLPITQQCAAILAHFVVVLLDFKPRLVWQTASGSDMDFFFNRACGSLMIIAKDRVRKYWSRELHWELYVKQRPRRICQSLLESHWHAFSLVHIYPLFCPRLSMESFIL